MQWFKKRFGQIAPHSIEDVFALRKSRIIEAAPILAISMGFAYLAEEVVHDERFIASVLLAISWFFFISFFIILFRYFGLLFRFRRYLDNYIVGSINSVGFSTDHALANNVII